jgi:hypothetical protein
MVGTDPVMIKGGIEVEIEIASTTEGVEDLLVPEFG